VSSFYDGVDNDWQAITLQNYGGIYATHEVRVSIPTQQQAAVLMVLLEAETENTAIQWDRMNRHALGAELGEH
jgi:hypothetical protein